MSTTAPPPVHQGLLLQRLRWQVLRNGWRLLREQTPGQWATVLRAGDGNGSWSHVGVHADRGIPECLSAKDVCRLPADAW